MIQIGCLSERPTKRWFTQAIKEGLVIQTKNSLYVNALVDSIVRIDARLFTIEETAKHLKIPSKQVMKFVKEFGVEQLPSKQFGPLLHEENVQFLQTLLGEE